MYTIQESIKKKKRLWIEILNISCKWVYEKLGKLFTYITFQGIFVGKKISFTSSKKSEKN